MKLFDCRVEILSIFVEDFDLFHHKVAYVRILQGPEKGQCIRVAFDLLTANFGGSKCSSSI